MRRPPERTVRCYGHGPVQVGAVNTDIMFCKQIKGFCMWMPERIAANGNDCSVR